MQGVPGSHFSLRFLQLEQEPIIRIKAASVRCLGSRPLFRPLATRPCVLSEEAVADIRPDWLSICIGIQPKELADVGEGEVLVLRCSARELLLDRVLLRERRGGIGDVDNTGVALETHREW